MLRHRLEMCMNHSSFLWDKKYISPVTTMLSHIAWMDNGCMHWKEKKRFRMCRVHNIVLPMTKCAASHLQIMLSVSCTIITCALLLYILTISQGVTVEFTTLYYSHYFILECILILVLSHSVCSSEMSLWGLTLTVDLRCLGDKTWKLHSIISVCVKCWPGKPSLQFISPTSQMNTALHHLWEAPSVLCFFI